MTTTWHGTFQDRHGTEEVEIENDGSEIHVTIRGVTFSGEPAALAPSAGTSVLEGLFDFDADSGEPCSYTMRWGIPVKVMVDGRAVDAMLDCWIRLGDPRPRRHSGLDADDVRLALRYADTHVENQRIQGFWDDALEELHSHLPTGVFLIGCITCVWANDHYVGAGLGGLVRCFNPRQTARQADPTFPRLSAWPFVQATWLCSEYEVQGRERKPKTRSFRFPYSQRDDESQQGTD